MGQLPKRDWDSNNGSVSNGNPVLAMAVSVKVIHGRCVYSLCLLLLLLPVL